MTVMLANSPRRRSDASLIGQLNTEWERLRGDEATALAVTGWGAQQAALAGCATLGHVERAVADDADAVLLALLRLAHGGDQLAGRTVVQLMLGKAVRIAAGHAGRAPRAELEASAVTALWDVIATYPVTRRPAKVAANIAMDTLHRTVAEFAHDRHEHAVAPDTLDPLHEHATGTTTDGGEGPADLDLLNLLAWAVDSATITGAEAALLVDIYAPAPGRPGGAAAAARHGLTWSAARQRASRAVRRITHAVRTDTADAAVA